MIAVWSSDRLGRSMSHLETIKGTGVGLYIHTQALDTMTPAGRTMFQMLGVFAEFERKMIRECVNSGLDRVRGEIDRKGVYATTAFAILGSEVTPLRADRRASNFARICANSYLSRRTGASDTRKAMNGPTDDATLAAASGRGDKIRLNEEVEFILWRSGFQADLLAHASNGGERRRVIVEALREKAILRPPRKEIYAPKGIEEIRL
jgi:hypothetical protein